MGFSLLKAYAGHLEQGFVDSKFRKPDREPGTYCPPTFFVGSLPAKRKENTPGVDADSRYPFILNRFKGGEDKEDESLITLHTVCGAWTADEIESGEHDIANMVMRCRRLILETQLLDNRFELVLPMAWHLGDSEDMYRQAHPYYSGELFSTWRIPAAGRLLTLEEEKKVYGA